MGKKRFLAQALRLEVFADRKIKKWQARANERAVRLIDAVGVSPIEEMMYFWNGYKRMSHDDLTKSLASLEWRNEELEDDAIDERAIYHLLAGVVLRNMGDLEGARERLWKVLSIDKSLLKGGLKDDWPGKRSVITLILFNLLIFGFSSNCPLRMGCSHLAQVWTKGVR